MKLRMHLLVAVALPGLCAPPALATGEDWIAVAPDVLDKQRGGFTTPAGLELSLGVQRLVSINGAPVTQVNVLALRAGAPGLALPLEGSARLIQQGGNNVFGAALDLPGATFIQNSLSGQTIRTETQVTASVNSAALMRDLNFYNSMREAAFSSSGTR